jgi:uncharacterized protein (PEP-CTERM system associated)
LAPLAVAAMLVALPCHAEWKFSPRVDLRETYSDNVNNQAGDAARGAWVSELAPSFDLFENSARLKVSAHGDLHGYAYSEDDLPYTNKSARNFNGTGKAMLVENYFYTDASASSSRQAISALGATTANPFSSTNTTQIETWSVSPYFQHRFGANTDVLVRYTRDDVRGDLMGYGSNIANTRLVQFGSGNIGNTLSWGLLHTHQDLHSQYGGDSSSENDLLNGRWSLQRVLALTASVGYDNYDFPSLGQRTAGRSWSGGFIWTPSGRTRVELSMGHRYFGKTGMLNSSYRTQHTVWTLTYDDNVTTSRSQFLLPTSVNVAAMLDSLFAAAYPDPTLRQQAIASYIAANGLSPQLTTNVNYLSNRYFRDRRLQGGVTFTGARSSLALAVFRDERNALSMADTDSILLGSNQLSANDNVRQKGLNGVFDYHLSSRTTASVTASLSRLQSMTTNTRTNNKELHLRLQRNFTKKINGNVELRRVSGRYDFTTGGDYHENAVAAGLTVAY